MAYFSNGSEGDCFDEQCAICKYGELPCPIAAIQMEFNYDAVNNEVATMILYRLVSNKGECSMFKTFQKDFEIPKDEKEQLKFEF
jgi:formate hydrogenlyase subunit 6/NADH:ubiquinone oxidoreductase subunit I